MRLAGACLAAVRRGALAFAALGVLGACTAEADGPSRGSYTLTFPSTAAAVAADDVTVAVFDAPSEVARATYCQDLIQARRRKEPLSPLSETSPMRICAMLDGLGRVEVDYGERAVLAVARRAGVDFLVGCALARFGDGDAPVDVQLALVDVTLPVPFTSCVSVRDVCSGACPR